MFVYSIYEYLRALKGETLKMIGLESCITLYVSHDSIN